MEILLTVDVEVRCVTEIVSTASVASQPLLLIGRQSHYMVCKCSVIMTFSGMKIFYTAHLGSNNVTTTVRLNLCIRGTKNIPFGRTIVLGGEEGVSRVFL